MGVGTIVGSAMFNILVIVALSCAVAGASGASLLIDWRPVARDVTFYCTSIVMLAVFFNDGKVETWEAVGMVLGYGPNGGGVHDGSRLADRARQALVMAGVWMSSSQYPWVSQGGGGIGGHR